MTECKPHFDVMSLFDHKENNFVKVAAPMVRYSKLQFRTLLRNYSCDLCFTPMILADSFCLSDKARNNEFTTNLCDSPVVTQFAANDANDFVYAAKLVSPFCDGVDLNCGCPQRWAKQMGVGCIMLEKPQMIYDIVRRCTNQICRPFTISVKMRILNDLKKTVEICKQLENCGVSFLTVHSRTSLQSTGDINLEALTLIAENLNIPLIANGGMKNLEECYNVYKQTNCKGVMVANGLLTNPMLFTGVPQPTVSCIQKWTNICYNSTLKLEYHDISKLHPHTIPEKPPNLTFQCFHHHLVFMLEKILPKSKRRVFNSYQYFADVLQFLQKEFGVLPQLYDLEEFTRERILPTTYNITNTPTSKKGNPLSEYNYEETDGEYFRKKSTIVSDDESYGIGEMFHEN